MLIQQIKCHCIYGSTYIISLCGRFLKWCYPQKLPKIIIFGSVCLCILISIYYSDSDMYTWFVYDLYIFLVHLLPQSHGRSHHHLTCRAVTIDIVTRIEVRWTACVFVAGIFMKKSDGCAKRIKKPSKICTWRGVLARTLCRIHIKKHKHPFRGDKETSLTADVGESEALAFLWWIETCWLFVAKILGGKCSSKYRGCCLDTSQVSRLAKKIQPDWTQFLWKNLERGSSPQAPKSLNSLGHFCQIKCPGGSHSPAYLHLIKI